MSSFIINDDTINKLIGFFTKCAYSNEEFKPCVGRILKENGYNLEYYFEEKNDANKLGADMKRLNEWAYSGRYKKESEEVVFNYAINSEYSLIQILKSLQCFIYQCSEGDCMQDELYKILVKIEKILMGHIVTHLKEYKEAKWC